MEYNFKECDEWVESSTVAARTVRFISSKLDKYDLSKVRDKSRATLLEGTIVVRKKVCDFVEDKEIEFMYDFCELENNI